MLYKFLVILHLLGATVWVGGHIVLVRVILPGAMREKSPARIKEFENGYGRMGLAALGLQALTGFWLATYWIGDLATIFSKPTPAAHLVLTKVLLLVVTILLAGRAYHKVLPELTQERMPAFAVHAWAVTLLGVITLVLGAAIRTGGLS